MISYAQNGEDVVLRRAFRDNETGFYIDVGACDPIEDSVTCHFYERGWRGINIDPDARWFDSLREVRQRDINIQAAVGTGGGFVSFFPSSIRGHGTVDASVAVRRDAAPPEAVRRITLTEVAATHAAGQTIDFLKIDVEGWESDVLASFDLNAFRPRVILVEAVDQDGAETHQAWEPGLLGRGYRFALFDGLNRFYCRDEEADMLLPRLAAPANVLDDFRLAREVRRSERELEQERARTLAAMANERAALRERDQAQAEARRAWSACAAAERAEQAAQQALAREAAAHAACQAHLNLLLASTSWRITEPLRNTKRLLKLCLPRGGPD
jgi:FkbM family methyltransferase